MFQIVSVEDLPEDTRHWVIVNVKKHHSVFMKKATHVWMVNEIIQGVIFLKRNVGYASRFATSAMNREMTVETEVQIAQWYLEQLKCQKK